MQRVFLILLLILTIFCHHRVEAFEHLFLCADGSEKAIGNVPLSAEVQHFLVIFAKFKDEAQDETTVPDYASDIFREDLPGSFAKIVSADSLGAITTMGECLERIYESHGTMLNYGEKTYGQFNLDILYQVDDEIDFGLYDNDGPDGLPNSGDDDGYVDFLFINLKSAPQNFLDDGEAEGVPSLGFTGEYVTNDPVAGKENEMILIDAQRGTTQVIGDFPFTVGAMLHEYGHIVSRSMGGDRKRFDTDNFLILHDVSSKELYEKQRKAQERKKRFDLDQRKSSAVDTSSEKSGRMFQNYPNPFNATTSIRYVVQRHEHVSLSIHNLLGQEVVRLTEAFLQPGDYSVEWDGRDTSGKDVPSGMYFCRIKMGDSVRYQRVVLMR